MKRENFLSGSPWESKVGYSRLVKFGSFVFVSGTTAIDENGNVVGVGNSYKQTKYIIQKIEKSLNMVNTSLTEVVRTRIYTTNIEEWELIGKAHAEFFKDIKPATTMVEVRRLIQPELIVEVEVDVLMDKNNS